MQKFFKLRNFLFCFIKIRKQIKMKLKNAVFD